MPSEALGTSSCEHGSPLDMFSFGVVALFTATQVFPKDFPAPNYIDKRTNRVKTLAKIECWVKYMGILHETFPKKHPMTMADDMSE